MSVLRSITRISGAGTGGDAFSIQHWSGVATTDPGELTDQAEEVRDRLFAAWGAVKALMVSTARVHAAERVLLIEPEPPGDIPFTPAPEIVCTNPVHPLPWVAQGVITLRTGEATRHGRGRIFIPYLTEDSNDQGVPNATCITAMNNFADKLAEAVGITPLNLVVWNREARVATNVGVAQARNYWAYLSSRRD